MPTSVEHNWPALTGAQDWMPPGLKSSAGYSAGAGLTDVR